MAQATIMMAQSAHHVTDGNQAGAGIFVLARRNERDSVTCFDTELKIWRMASTLGSAALDVPLPIEQVHLSLDAALG
jgi:hypothetical protein